MNIVFQIDFTGSPDAEDQLAARHIIFLENQRRSRLTPPGTPLPFANITARLNAGETVAAIIADTAA